MTIYQNSSKIRAEHLNRKAIVYVRQSTAKQVRQNTESQRLQYALVERAKELGWRQVEVIDTDLGASAGLGAAKREGFDRIIASVAKAEVGIVFSREASRLSRTDKDWSGKRQSHLCYGWVETPGLESYVLTEKR